MENKPFLFGCPFFKGHYVIFGMLETVAHRETGSLPEMSMSILLTYCWWFVHTSQTTTVWDKLPTSTGARFLPSLFLKTRVFPEMFNFRYALYMLFICALFSRHFFQRWWYSWWPWPWQIPKFHPTCWEPKRRVCRFFGDFWVSYLLGCGRKMAKMQIFLRNPQRLNMYVILVVTDILGIAGHTCMSQEVSKCLVNGV